MTVLGDVGHAQQAALADGGVGDVVAAEADLAGGQGLQTRQAVDELRLAVAVDAGETDDLAAADLEAHVLDGVVLMHLTGHGHVLHVQHHVAGGGCLFLHVEVDVPAHHHGGKLLHGGVLRLYGAHVPALAEHGAAVRHGHDLVELVGDEQNRLALRRQAAHDLHELIDLLGRQHRRGLVENKYLVLAIQHFQDLRALLHAHGDVFDQRVGVYLQAVLLAEGQYALPSLLLLEEAVLRGLHAHDDIVQHGEALHQFEVLVDHADTQRVGIVGVLDADLHAVLLDGALLRLVQAEQDAHQCGLSGAVLAQ